MLKVNLEKAAHLSFENLPLHQKNSQQRIMTWLNNLHKEIDQFTHKISNFQFPQTTLPIVRKSDLIRALATFNKHCCFAILHLFGLFNALLTTVLNKYTGRCQKICR
jgi:hypothetical protein